MRTSRLTSIGASSRSKCPVNQLTRRTPNRRHRRRQRHGRGLVGAYAAAGGVDHFVFSERIPSVDDVEHLCQWALRVVTR
jgi:hypothetical protein